LNVEEGIATEVRTGSADEATYDLIGGVSSSGAENRRVNSADDTSTFDNTNETGGGSADISIRREGNKTAFQNRNGFARNNGLKFIAFFLVEKELFAVLVKFESALEGNTKDIPLSSTRSGRRGLGFGLIAKRKDVVILGTGRGIGPSILVVGVISDSTYESASHTSIIKSEEAVNLVLVIVPKRE